MQAPAALVSTRSDQDLQPLSRPGSSHPLAGFGRWWELDVDALALADGAYKYEFLLNATPKFLYRRLFPGANLRKRVAQSGRRVTGSPHRDPLVMPVREAAIEIGLELGRTACHVPGSVLSLDRKQVA